MTATIAWSSVGTGAAPAQTGTPESGSTSGSSSVEVGPEAAEADRSEPVRDEWKLRSRTYATDVPGVFVTDAYSVPVNVRDAAGEWQPADARLRETADGQFETVRTAVDIDVSADPSADELVTVGVGGNEVGFGLEDAVGRDVSFDDIVDQRSEFVAGIEDIAYRTDTIVYDAILPGVTAEVTPMREGVKEVLVLDDPDAERDIEFDLSLDGLTARLNDLGEIEYVDGHQTVVAMSPVGFMEDSADEGSGIGRVDYRLEGPASNPTLHLDLDDTWLDSPDREWPVRVDPSVYDVESQNDDTFVLQNWGSPVNWSTHPELRTGTDDGGAHLYRSFMHFGTAALAGKQILNAQLSLWGTSSPSCTARRVNVRRITSSWTGSALLQWADQPSSTEVANAVVPGFGHPGCNPSGAYFTFPGLTQTVQDWADGVTTNRGLSLRSHEEANNSFHRRFTSSSGPVGSIPPLLSVTWQTPLVPPAITSHTVDQLVFDTEALTATPATGATVTSMQFRVDGTPVGAPDTTPPYTTSWNTTPLPDGAHTLTVRANLAGGATIDSAPVVVEVANGADSNTRLRSDARAGRITDDQFVRNAMFSMFDQSAIPARYRSTTPDPLHPTESMMALLANWDLLDQDTKEELLNAGQSSIEEAPAALTESGGTGDCVDLFTGRVFEVEIDLLCRFRTEHLDIYYQESGPWAVEGTDADANGRPDYIDDMGESMEAAYNTYEDLDYQPPDVDGSFYDKLPVVVADLGIGSDAFAVPVGHPLILMPPDGGAHYLGRHELFHLFQYNYTSLCDIEGFLGIGFACPGDRASTIWWLEATAEWAAHQASSGFVDDEDQPNSYARHIPEFLADPTDALSTYDSIVNIFEDGSPVNLNVGGPGDQPYGSVLFVEYLDLRFGQDFIHDTFSELDEGDSRSALEVIEDLLEGETASSYEELLPEFWSAAYLLADVNDEPSDTILDFEGDDLDAWQEFVGDATELDGDDFSPVNRMARQETVLSDDINAWSPFVEVEVQPGGSAFIEFKATDFTPQYVEFEVHTLETGRLNKVRLTTIPMQDPGLDDEDPTNYPRVCEEPDGRPIYSTVAPDDGTDVLEVPGRQGSHFCRGATLVITHVDPDSDDDIDHFLVAARGVSNT